MFTTILIGLVIILSIVAVIAAPASVVFDLVNDFHQWQAWSPYVRLDPAAKNTFAGSPAGQGAVFTWSGNNKIGEGRMTILDSHPSDLIRIKLEFTRPFSGTNTAEFTFKSEGGQTTAVWSMFGMKNFISKAFCLFMNVDKMVGGDFEKGLANLKAIAETAV